MSSATTEQGPYLGGMLRPCWQWVRDEIFSGVLAAGYDDLSAAHVGVFRYPGLDGQRPSELAEQLRITRQSVNDLVGHLERCGYITREDDPTDRRARVVRLTAKGQRLQNTITDEARAAEQRMAEWLGPRRYSQLRAALAALDELIHTDHDD